MGIKYTSMIHFKATQNISRSGIFGMKIYIRAHGWNIAYVLFYNCCFSQIKSKHCFIVEKNRNKKNKMSPLNNSLDGTK
jgi:hypothetical protein